MGNWTTTSRSSFADMYYDGAKAGEGDKLLAASALYLALFSRKGVGHLPWAARAP